MSSTTELTELHELIGSLRRCVTSLASKYGDSPATRRIRRTRPRASSTAAPSPRSRAATAANRAASSGCVAASPAAGHCAGSAASTAGSAAMAIWG